MTDVDLDLTTLTTARTRVDRALRTFAEAGSTADGLAEHTGDRRLAGRVRDFAGNWDDNRGKLEEQLTAVRDRLQAIVDTYSELDASMAAGVDETGATP
ncbi:hypothetical protein [Microbacterium sp. 10M-3C3]|jgi:hypothetical protein|uniref:hypothetical protein n=1 Tax=Microbacterium sp. 10M-3C3 TaxID=2483401 RepID=UPI000F62E81F|nr:hypothetical protein [Microbacterium sp. 10M-3C3]